MAKAFGIGVESTWDTPVTPNKFFDVTSEDIHIEKTPIEVATFRAPSTRAVENDQERVVGTFEALCNFQEVGFWLYQFMGDVDVTGVGPYTHTIPGSTGVTDTKSFTLEVERDFTAFTYPGMMMTAFGLDIQRGQALTVRGGYQGSSASVATGAATSPTYLTLDVAVPRQVVIDIDASPVDATNFTLDAVWPVDDPYVLGSISYGKQPLRQVLGVSFSFQYLFTVSTVYDLFVANTEIDVQVDVQTAGDEALTINLDKCRITEHPHPLDGRQRVLATASGIAFFNTTATENMQSIVINDQTTTDFS